MRVLQNDRFLRALARKPVDRTPVWMMRQAGRYLPEYRASRAKAGDFMALCRNAELCCEVTLQPLDRYPGLDTAILFSDILTVPDAMGLGLRFVEGEGPMFDRPVRDAASIAALPIPDPEGELRYVMNAVRTIRAALGDRCPLIGFAGSPWTLATYMVEGQGGQEFTRIKRMRFEAPALLAQLLDKLVEATTLYLDAQACAGADALMVFDTWGGVLDHAGYRQFSLEPMQRIVTALKKKHPEIPVMLFTKNGGQQLEAMAATGCDGLGLDWTTDIGAARARVGHPHHTAGEAFNAGDGPRVALQGNLDPLCLLASPEAIRAEVARVLASYGQGSGHIFNLGHGITPQVNPDHAGAMIEAVVQLSPRYHQVAL